MKRLAFVVTTSRPVTASHRPALLLALALGSGTPAVAQDLPTVVPPGPFGVHMSVADGHSLAGEDYRRAMQCLTEAIYYEAASEPRAGQEAVAQVVINRTRHPAFPKSVCGVVFEGSSRSTGCQFTFTCDGSLSRRPVSWKWQEARSVAANALGGRVADSIGASTHYHANWMTPYWSSSLIETARIGGHVFYQMPGAGAAMATFNGGFGAEPAEPPAPSLVSTASSARRSKRTRAASRPLLPPADPGPSTFSAWGLRIATITPQGHALLVRADTAPAATPANVAPDRMPFR